MAERTHREPQRREDETSDVGEAVPARNEDGSRLKAELDDLLDEIDEVLESNAEEFVKSYVQKGGQ
jgi:ubiquitin-like protein Pup